MQWQHNYLAVGNQLWLSAACAAIPILLLFILVGFWRMAAWKAALIALVTASLIACFAFKTPVPVVAASTGYGVAFGLFPICWIVLPAIFLYRITVDSGQFEIIKDSIAQLTDDLRLQTLLIAFAFGAFIEGAAGFGAPVAIAGAMLTGLGMRAFQASSLCLLANTAPVAFGSIGIPIITLAALTGLPLDKLSASVGRISPILSLIIPCYLMIVFVGWRKTRGVIPAIAIVSIAFAGIQFVVSNYFGPYLTDILAALAAIVCCVVLLQFWNPGDKCVSEISPPQRCRHSARVIFKAWSPYLLLVIFVLLWGYEPLKRCLNSLTLTVEIPYLHNVVMRVPPVVEKATNMSAVFRFDWLATAGTACFLAGIFGGLVAGMTWKKLMSVLWKTLFQLGIPVLTVTSVLGFAFLMNFSGMTSTLGLAFASTGWFFPFFSAFLGWLGVFVTGSDTSANALFGSLQVTTAQALGLNPLLMAATNSAAGVMGKMISLQSIAVVLVATGMPQSDESKLFRWAIIHSILLTAVIGLVAMVYAHLLPFLMPVLDAK